MFLSSMIAKQAGRGMNKKVCKQMIKASLLNNSSNNNIIVQRQTFSTEGSGSHPDFEAKRKPIVENAEDTTAFIQSMIDNAADNKRPLLFMKGTPEQPSCGFSYQVVRVLHAEGVDFDSFNVLADAEVREEIKSFSDWPTIPQLYVDKEFVGGCDIVTSMHQDGELATLFQEVGVVVAD